MPILLLLAFNWYVLFAVLYVGDSFYHPVMTPALTYPLVALSFVGVCALAFLFNSPAGQWFLRLLSGARKSIGREQAKLDPIIAQVQERITAQLGFAPIAVTLMVIDDPIPNAMAVGKNTLIVSRALYETANDDELSGVIAHEFGHLHNGDSHRLGMALGVSVVSLVISLVSGIVLNFSGNLAKNASKSKEEIGMVLTVFSAFFMIISGIFWVLVKMGNGVLRVVMLFVGRKQEYAADQFAVKAGYGAGVLSFLDKIKNMQFGKPKTIFARLYETHPPIMLRIGELEKIMGV